VLNIFLFLEKPDNPITPASLADTATFWPSIKILIKNQNYLLLLIGTGLVTAACYLKIGYLYFMVKPYGFTQEFQNLLGTYHSLGGIMGRFIFGFFIGNFLGPFNLIKLVPILCLISMFLFWLSLYMQSMIFGGINCFIWGMFADSHALLAEEISVRLTFPVDEIHSVGNIFTAGSFLTTVMGLSLSKIYEVDEKYWAPFTFGGLCIFYIIATFCFILIKSINKRESYETKLNIS
jgi:hypothetical protein